MQHNKLCDRREGRLLGGIENAKWFDARNAINQGPAKTPKKNICGFEFNGLRPEKESHASSHSRFVFPISRASGMKKASRKNCPLVNDLTHCSYLFGRSDGPRPKKCMNVYTHV